MDRQEVLRTLSHHKPEMQRRFGVDNLAIFGSVARGESRPASDLDVLVVFKDRPSFDGYMDLRFYLEDLLGLTIDLVTEKGLRRELRSVIEREAIHVP